MSKSNREKYRARKAAHCCVWCGESDERTQAGRIYCQKHAKYHSIVTGDSNSKRYYRRQLNHECVDCGKPLPDGYYYTNCLACREKHKQAYRKRKTARSCNSEAVNGK